MSQRDQPSGNTPGPSRPMTLVGERRVDEARPLSIQDLSQMTTGSSATAPTTTTTQLSQEYIHRAAWKAAVLGALNIATAILAVRLTLLVAVGGAISLTWLALRDPDPYRLGALGVYALVVVVPLVWLAGRR